MGTLLSTADAARAVGVTPSTVKRWADAGLLECVRTAGGHRRFALEAVERLAREAAQGGEEAAEAGLVELLVNGASYEIEAALLQARARLGAWHRVADGLGAVLDQIGELWCGGAISVLDEHVASERLARALARVGESLPLAPDAPRLLLATADGDEHTLGLSLVELTAREAGWQPLWSGRRTPPAELVERVTRGGVQLVALSASAHSRDGAALTRQARRLAAACRDAGVGLVLGGRGAWPDALPGVARLHDFATLYGSLSGAG